MGDAAEEQENGLRVDVFSDREFLLRRRHERSQPGDQRLAPLARLSENRIRSGSDLLEERVVDEKHEVCPERAFELRRPGILEHGSELVEAAPDESLLQFFDDREVAIHGRDTHASRASHGVQPDAGTAVDQRSRRLQNVQPIPVGVSTRRLHAPSICGSSTIRISYPNG